MKKFDFKWKGGQLGRTIIEESREKTEEYMRNKYPKREILSIEEITKD